MARQRHGLVWLRTALAHRVREAFLPRCRGVVGEKNYAKGHPTNDSAARQVNAGPHAGPDALPPRSFSGPLVTYFCSLPLAPAGTRMPVPLMNMDRPRVLLAEDNADTAERLRKLLGADFDVIALVEDGEALVDAAERLSPDVIVTDIAMPGMDGIEATVMIRRHDPNARIVFVTVHAESMLIEAGLDAGCTGLCAQRRGGRRPCGGDSGRAQRPTGTSVLSSAVRVIAAGPSMVEERRAF